VLKFNPTSRLLISGSADNTVRLIAIPDGLGDNCTFYPRVILYRIGFTVLLSFVSVVELCSPDNSRPFHRTIRRCMPTHDEWRYLILFSLLHPPYRHRIRQLVQSETHMTSRSIDKILLFCVVILPRVLSRRHSSDRLCCLPYATNTAQNFCCASYSMACLAIRLSCGSKMVNPSPYTVPQVSVRLDNSWTDPGRVCGVTSSPER
jgi:hypothetical protein